MAPQGAQSAHQGTQRARMRAPAVCCVGCENQGRPGRSGTAYRQHRSSGNRHRRERLGGAAAAFERAGVQRVVHGVVRSTAPHGVRPRRARASEASTATSAAQSAVTRRPRRCGEQSGRATHQARRTGTGGERSEPPRQARSRSDAPNRTTGFITRVTSIGTGITNAVDTSVGIVVGTIDTGTDRRCGEFCIADCVTRCRRRAVEPPRSAPCDAKASAATAVISGAAVTSDSTVSMPSPTSSASLGRPALRGDDGPGAGGGVDGTSRSSMR